MQHGTLKLHLRNLQPTWAKLGCLSCLSPRCKLSGKQETLRRPLSAPLNFCQPCPVTHTRCHRQADTNSLAKANTRHKNKIRKWQWSLQRGSPQRSSRIYDFPHLQWALKPRIKQELKQNCGMWWFRHALNLFNLRSRWTSFNGACIYLEFTEQGMRCGLKWTKHFLFTCSKLQSCNLWRGLFIYIFKYKRLQHQYINTRRQPRQTHTHSHTHINTHKLAFTIPPDALNKSKCATVWVCVCMCVLAPPPSLCCSCSAAAFAIYLRVLCAENLPAGHQSPFTARTYTLRPAQPSQAGRQAVNRLPWQVESENWTENWQRGAHSAAASLGLWAACQHFGRKNAIALNNNSK